MMLTKELITENIGFILIAFIVLVALILIVLKMVEKRLYKKIIKRKTGRDNFYRTEIQKVVNQDPKETLKNIERLSKDFFKEAFDMKKSKEFSELEKIFIQKNNKAAAEFCKIMNHVLYAGEELDINYVQRLVILLTNIIQTNHIMTDDEKQALVKQQSVQTQNTNKEEKKDQDQNNVK